jgi:hypothetical protein
MPSKFLALTSSARINRVVHVKTTAVAFGSSTPTNRLPMTIVKTPGPIAIPTPNASIAQKMSTPKSKYNLRTRLFNNPISKDKDEDEVIINQYSNSLFLFFQFLEKISTKKTVTNTQINHISTSCTCYYILFLLRFSTNSILLSRNKYCLPNS